VNKAWGVGMIEGVPTCPLSFRAEVLAGVTTPALTMSSSFCESLQLVASSLPSSLLSFGDLGNKAFGVGMIEDVTTCSLSLRAKVRAGVTTPALASLASVLRARTASSAVSPLPRARCLGHLVRRPLSAACRNDVMTRSWFVGVLGWSARASAMISSLWASVKPQVRR
jgi:hypothetical protein